ncbi:hypothetical protein FRB94_007099 [Tulasnella sp. JGI-2019a]|nr:hypothetical protein FRB94_007099 [Tulasnella sp. JGI-2019a]KAG9017010.1 hypothetical protein FRB93_009540 [Tulasnella sp. JGI-2019a]KAG9040093.1 hypothetical protein FRB95_000022 [Tulasnella sp. JGI-2019a]
MSSSRRAAAPNAPTQSTTQAVLANGLETLPDNPVHRPHDNDFLPNTPLASSLVAFLLGCTFSLGVVLFLVGGIDGSWWAKYQLGFFVASWAAFHWAEFAVTAGWNREKVNIDSYLLNNGPQYHMANGFAVLEFLVTCWFFPTAKSKTSISIIGIIMTVASQALRSTAMIHAASNFAHLVAWEKLDTHQLVTNGVYAWMRHPSYTGFFFWGLGTQLALQNPISFVIYAVVLWRFFYFRIIGEEKSLVRFFGDDYVQYRKRVGTWIPGIP